MPERFPTYFLINLFNKFIYFWLRWVFIAALRLSLVAVSWGYSSLRCVGFSLWWLLLLRSIGSRPAGFSSCGSRVLERRPSSCGAQAQLLRSIGDLPGPGIEPVSPALAGGFLTTAPPGKPNTFFLSLNICQLALYAHFNLPLAPSVLYQLDSNIMLAAYPLRSSCICDLNLEII